MAPIALEPHETESYYEHQPGAGSDKATACEDSVLFGFGDNAWRYYRSTQRFDLSRGSPQKLIIDADHGVNHHRGVTIDPTKTVLVVIDMQNFWIHPTVRDHIGGMKAVDPTLKTIKRCREEGIKVAWLNWGIDDHDLGVMPPAVQRGFCENRMKIHGHGWHTQLGSDLPKGQGRCLWKGSWNAALYDPFMAVSRDDDLFFDKNRPSGMWSVDEPLRRYMEEHQMKTMLFCGVNTDQCVLGTITDSYSAGYDCIMLTDCVGTMTGLGAKELCEYNVATNYGFVTDSEAFSKAYHHP